MRSLAVIAGAVLSAIAPFAIPVEILGKLNVDIGEVVRSASYKQRVVKQGAEPVADTAAEFRKVIKTEYDKWGEVIRSAGGQESVRRSVRPQEPLKLREMK
jgi:tripartite-type tricarboxylate transporter receptor subunit TctC